jgi:2'-5' RNA ligase
MPAMAEPLILTATMEKPAFARFDALRRAHFPAERNIVPAHLTLFHHLPGTEADEIGRRLEMVARGTRRLAARVAGLRNLGRGVAFRIDSPALQDLRAALAEAWALWLIPQDRQPFQPHVTVQNKVEPGTAKALYERLLADFTPQAMTIEGLALWRYLGGPWEKLKDYRFR